MLDLSVMREELGVGPDAERILKRLRSEVVALFERATGRDWSRQVDKVEHRARCGATQQVIYLDLLPVETIASITERAIGMPDPVTVDPSAYFLDPGMGRLEKLAGPWLDRITITYTAGIDSSGRSTPGDIEAALLAQAKYMHERFRSDRIAVVSSSTGGGSRSGRGSAEFYMTGAYHPLFEEVVKRNART